MSKHQRLRKAQVKAYVHYRHQVKRGLDAYHGQFIDPIGLAFSEKRISARLQDPKNARNKDAYKRRPPLGYYVIIGRGAAAVVNHTTLRQGTSGKERLQREGVDLPVLHIGMPDPWLHYHEHGMGQPPYLLRLPGYHHPVPLNSRQIHTGLSSVVFAESTRAELALLEEKFVTCVTEGWAAAIESRTVKASAVVQDEIVNLGVPKGLLDTILASPWGDEFPPYRVVVVSPECTVALAYAYKIDICTGAGRMRLDPREIVPVPDLIKAARTKPWISPDNWDQATKNRRVIHGMDGLTEAMPWDAEHRICVYGSGGIGLNQMERAKDVKPYVDWLARDNFHNPTFNLRRNDNVLKAPGALVDETYMPVGGADAIRRPDGSFDETVPLYPGAKRWRMARVSKVRTVALAEAGLKVQVGLVPSGDARVTCWDQVAAPLNPPATYFPLSPTYQGDNPNCVAGAGVDGDTFDRLILCLGQVQTVAGEPDKLAAGFTFDPIAFHTRLSGLVEHEHGDIRILGAAAAMRAGIGGTDPGRNMETYRSALPASAVLPGFILSAVSIASVNGFFDDTPNNNANTASEAELIQLINGVVASEPVAKEIAVRIIEGRKFPNNGFADVNDLSARTRRDPPIPSMVATWETVFAVLTTDYRAADDWSHLPVVD